MDKSLKSGDASQENRRRTAVITAGWILFALSSFTGFPATARASGPVLRTIKIVAAVDEDFRRVFGPRADEVIRDAVRFASSRYEGEERIRIRLELDSTAPLQSWSPRPLESFGRSGLESLQARFPLGKFGPGEKLVIGFSSSRQLKIEGSAVPFAPYLVVRRTELRNLKAEKRALSWLIAHEVGHVFGMFHEQRPDQPCLLMRPSITVGTECESLEIAFDDPFLRVIDQTRGYDFSKDVRQLNEGARQAIIALYNEHGLKWPEQYGSLNPIAHAFADVAHGLYFHGQHDDAAREMASAALSYDPAQAEALYTLAMITLYWDKNPPLAVSLFDRIPISRRDPQTHHQRAMALFYGKAPENRAEILRELDTALVENPNPAELRLNRAQFFLESGDTEAARRELAQVDRTKANAAVWEARTKLLQRIADTAGQHRGVK